MHNLGAKSLKSLKYLDLATLAHMLCTENFIQDSKPSLRIASLHISSFNITLEYAIHAAGDLPCFSHVLKSVKIYIADPRAIQDTANRLWMKKFRDQQGIICSLCSENVPLYSEWSIIQLAFLPHPDTFCSSKILVFDLSVRYMATVPGLLFNWLSTSQIK